MIFVDKAMELIMLTSFDNYMTCLKTPKETETNDKIVTIDSPSSGFPIRKTKRYLQQIQVYQYHP